MKDIEYFEDMARQGQLPDRYFDAARRLINELDEVNKAAKVRKFKAGKLATQIEHYGRSMAARCGLKGLKIKVEIEA